MLEAFQAIGFTSFLIGSILLFSYMLFRGFSLIFFSLFFTLFFLYFWPSQTFWLIFAAINFVLLVRPVRVFLITKPIIRLIKKKKLLPEISETEETALRAGDTWIESELFSGRPNFKKIFKEPYNKLSKTEKAYIDGPVNKVCEMTDDWQVFSKRDLPKEVWDYLKKEKFFGMIIPKQYGGLGFSALGHSEVVAKLATRSQVLAITVMVPNSLGPAELLMAYGTKKQKEFYLPRLADGREIPCFALTEPTAGSDATSIKAEGEVFKDKSGKVKIKLNFKKRYITLGAIATVIGLAFKLRDPKNILGQGEDLGINCALLKHTLKGIERGQRHDPLNVPFINAPIIGKNVVISLDDIIGGRAQIGQGWKMLMESLAVGRGISLPATSTGGSKLLARLVGNYSLIRKQFGLSIGKFEGIKSPMAEIAGFTYMLDAARVFTASAIDNGHKPSVANAIAKYHFTEKFREIVNHSMDIVAGAAICRGPRNLVAHAYMGSPIAITVEGANIMTRSLIHFGQGAIRCHPYSYDEMKALMTGDDKKFDYLLFKHIGHLYRNKFRSIILSLSRGRFHATVEKGVVKKYERKLAWASASFAFYADIALALYGGNIKRKEQINGRFGDILSYMYLASCVIRRFIAGGRKKQDEIYLRWSLDYCFSEIQKAFSELFKNLTGGVLGKFFKIFGGFYNRLNPIGDYPLDKNSNKLADSLMQDSKFRDDLTSNIFISQKTNSDHLAKMEKVFKEMQKAAPIEEKIKQAIRTGKLNKKSRNIYLEAKAKKIITAAEQSFLTSLEKKQLDIIEVDSYKIADYLKRNG